MHEDAALNGGDHTVSIAPRLRVVTNDHEPLPEEPTPHELRTAVGSLETCVHHNFKAVQQDLDDIRAQLRLVGQTAAEGLAAANRTESIVQDIVRIVDELAKRLYRSELPTQPELPRSEDLNAG